MTTTNFDTLGGDGEALAANGGIPRPTNVEDAKPPARTRVYQKPKKYGSLNKKGGGGAPLGVRGGGWRRRAWSTARGGVRAPDRVTRTNRTRARSPDQVDQDTRRTVTTGQRTAALDPSVATNTGNETSPGNNGRGARREHSPPIRPRDVPPESCSDLAVLTDERAPGESSRAVNSSPGFGWLVGSVSAGG